MRKLTMQDINAYLDGALSDEERLEIETVLARDPSAQSMVNRYRRQVDELRRMYDSVMDEPVPETMLSLLRSGSVETAQAKNTKVQNTRAQNTRAQNTKD